MKVKRISNTSEVITFNELQKGLEESDYLIFAKLPLKDVLDLSDSRNLTTTQRNFLNTSHFDFVITDSKHIPVFAVEFDGPHHLMRPEVRRRDITKNRLCQLAKLPLLRVNDVELEQFETISILQYIAYRFAKWTEAVPPAIPETTTEQSETSNELMDILIRDMPPFANVDPLFKFDERFRFPVLKDIYKELDDIYGMTAFFPKHDDGNSFWYSILPKSLGSRENGTTFSTYTYGICKGKGDPHILFKAGNSPVHPGITVLKEEEVSVCLRSSLLTDEQYDYQEAPIFYAQKTGFLPIYDNEIPGAHIPEVADAICEYICAKRILEWARHHFKK